MTPDFAALLYLGAAVCFILALKGLASPDSARRGNLFGIAGMAIAVVTTLLQPGMSQLGWTAVAGGCGALVGAAIALRIEMKAMPQLVAAFHSLVGVAAVLVAWAALLAPDAYGIGAVGSIHLASRIEMALGMVIGAITFTGSVVAFLKLQGLVGGSPTVFPLQHPLNLLIGIVIIVLTALFVGDENLIWFAVMTGLALLIGVLLIIPIGGADMPVVVSMLNSYSGWAAAGIGFTLQNTALIIVGALVGSSGAILSYIMCRAMNRHFLTVILGGFGQEGGAVAADQGDRPAKGGNADDAAFIMGNASGVIIVPGYGMAVAQAQHALREMADLLKEKGVTVRYAIHPVAGRMPGTHERAACRGRRAGTRTYLNSRRSTATFRPRMSHSSLAPTISPTRLQRPTRQARSRGCRSWMWSRPRRFCSSSGAWLRVTPELTTTSSMRTTP